MNDNHPPLNLPPDREALVLRAFDADDGACSTGSMPSEEVLRRTERAVAEVRRDRLTNEEVLRRAEVVRNHKAAQESDHSDECAEPAGCSECLDDSIEAFRRSVQRIYDRQAIAALRFTVGQCMGMSLPPKPKILL